MTGNAAGGPPEINPAAAGLLFLLAEHPDLLHPVQGEIGPMAVELRVAAAHPCTRCGAVAAIAYVAGTDAGPRWVDFCNPCNAWFIAGGTD